MIISNTESTSIQQQQSSNVADEKPPHRSRFRKSLSRLKNLIKKTPKSSVGLDNPQYDLNSTNSFNPQTDPLLSVPQMEPSSAPRNSFGDQKSVLNLFYPKAENTQTLHMSTRISTNSARSDFFRAQQKSPVFRNKLIKSRNYSFGPDQQNNISNSSYVPSYFQGGRRMASSSNFLFQTNQDYLWSSGFGEKYYQNDLIEFPKFRPESRFKPRSVIDYYPASSKIDTKYYYQSGSDFNNLLLPIPPPRKSLSPNNAINAAAIINHASLSASGNSVCTASSPDTAHAKKSTEIGSISIYSLERSKSILKKDLQIGNPKKSEAINFEFTQSLPKIPENIEVSKLTFSDKGNSKQEPISNNGVLTTEQFLKNIKAATNAVYLFLNAEHSKAEHILREGSRNGIVYFVECYATITLIKASISFDKTVLLEGFNLCTNMINTATEAKKKLKKSQNQDKKYIEHPQHLFSWLKSNVSNVTNITPFYNNADTFLKISNTNLINHHLELMTAEAYLLRSVANVILNGGIVAFFKDGWNIKKAYSTYKTYLGYVKWCTEQNSDEAIKANKSLDPDFKSSVYLGAGVFNIALSMLPQKLLKYLDFVGFVGNKQSGISALKIASELDYDTIFNTDDSRLNPSDSNNEDDSISVESFETAPDEIMSYSGTPNPSISINGKKTSSSDNRDSLEKKMPDSQIQKFNMRAEISALVLIFYHTVLSPESGSRDFDLNFAEKLIKYKLKAFPNSIILKYFAGKVLEHRCMLEPAILNYNLIIKQNIDSNNVWSKLTHIGFWEKAVSEMALGKWMMAYQCFERLKLESNWSKAVYTYCAAICLYERFLETKNTQLLKKVEQYLGEIPSLKKKIAGKSLIIEKYVIRKGRKFFDQGSFLLRPGLEMLLVTNFFSKMSRSHLLGIQSQLNTELVINFANKTPKKTRNLYDGEKKPSNTSPHTSSSKKADTIPSELLSQSWAIPESNSSSRNSSFIYFETSSETGLTEYHHFNYDDDLALVMLLQGVIHFYLAFPVCPIDKTNHADCLKNAKLSRIAIVRLLRLCPKIKYDTMYLAYGRYILGSIYMQLLEYEVAQLQFETVLDDSLFVKPPELFPNLSNMFQSSFDSSSIASKSAGTDLGTGNLGFLSQTGESYQLSLKEVKWWKSSFIDEPLIKTLQRQLTLNPANSNTTNSLGHNQSSTNNLHDLLTDKADLSALCFNSDNLAQAQVDLLFGWKKTKHATNYSMKRTVETYAHNSHRSIKP